MGEAATDIGAVPQDRQRHKKIKRLEVRRTEVLKQKNVEEVKSINQDELKKTNNTFLPGN
jgi:hypothetical protein